MKYQIDQSNKIEHTNKTTYVCLTNSNSFICSISAKEKQTLKAFFRKLNKPLIFKLFTFSVLCAKVIAASKAKSVTIDTEYLGHEINIKSFIFQILQIEKRPEVYITIKGIGKRSRSHLIGYKAMKNRNKGNAIRANEVIKYYEKLNKSKKRLDAL